MFTYFYFIDRYVLIISNTAQPMFYFVLWSMVMACNILKQLRCNKQEVVGYYIKRSVTITNHCLPWQPAMYANFIQKDRYILPMRRSVINVILEKVFGHIISYLPLHTISAWKVGLLYDSIEFFHFILPSFVVYCCINSFSNKYLKVKDIVKF